MRVEVKRLIEVLGVMGVGLVNDLSSVLSGL